MDGVRAALYIDFDNVFSGLHKLDPTAAMAFAEAPSTWLAGLSTAFTIDGPRRWLVRRCYMNPSGSIARPDAMQTSSRLYFSSFRAYFTKAGFEVIDCPALTSRNKNAADIRMVLDAMDALANETVYDEFVVASADSDLTPLLVRLRAADRRTTIVSPSDAAVAFTAIADRLIDGQQVLELLQSETSDSAGEEEAPGGASGEFSEEEVAQAGQAFDTLVRELFGAARGVPIKLPALAHEVQRKLGPVCLGSGWFGCGSFTKALESLAVPYARINEQALWDVRRERPDELAGSSGSPALPDSVSRVCAITDLPRVDRSIWSHVYQVLAEYAATHEFVLTESTRWSRDRLVEAGHEVGRGAVNFVVRGTAFGGCPLHRDPPPSADEIALAFTSNVLSQARAGQVGLAEAESDEVAMWLGAPGAR